MLWWFKSLLQLFLAFNLSLAVPISIDIANLPQWSMQWGMSPLLLCYPQLWSQFREYISTVTLMLTHTHYPHPQALTLSSSSHPPHSHTCSPAHPQHLHLYLQLHPHLLFLPWITPKQMSFCPTMGLALSHDIWLSYTICTFKCHAVELPIYPKHVSVLLEPFTTLILVACVTHDHVGPIWDLRGKSGWWWRKVDFIWERMECEVLNKRENVCGLGEGP